MSSEENKNRTIETFAEAVVEARRCLNCPRPLCRTGCPVENDIPAFIQALALGNVGAAAEIISARSNLPAICGRVCPHEQQCEARCILTNKGEGIRIGELERFVADLSNELILERPKIEKREGKIAIIGSGPAGISVAGDLAKMGFEVTIFEGQKEPGGVLIYGIPEFR
ncbi:MAG: NAD(P)-binding protein, partial [Negativicutes bacterium]|nr:NAD(P)-binding protein [Negativicutes bacterium]